MYDYVEYANYVAAEMNRNGYARQCLARGDVDEQLVTAFEADLNAASDERRFSASLKITLASWLASSQRTVVGFSPR
ncbi:hypothetical protein [Streptomyces sp. NPDC093568]|uniref:hypothetical protein n=1 Tax=Streptomyces sp. NPDC093568 TaxID=3366041 RepID=UPI00382E34E4